MKYAIKLGDEYMQERYGEDCFTDDLSFAILFDSRESAEDELIGKERVVAIHIDEDGGMCEQSCPYCGNEGTHYCPGPKGQV